MKVNGFRILSHWHAFENVTLRLSFWYPYSCWVTLYKQYYWLQWEYSWSKAVVSLSKNRIWPIKPPWYPTMNWNNRCLYFLCICRSTGCPLHTYLNGNFLLVSVNILEQSNIFIAVCWPSVEMIWNQEPTEISWRTQAEPTGTPIRKTPFSCSLVSPVACQTQRLGDLLCCHSQDVLVPSFIGHHSNRNLSSLKRHNISLWL